MSKNSQEIRRKARRAGKVRLSAVWLIYAREMRDQLRDRRTLFTIAVLPIMLYPLVGMLLLQVAQFSQKSETTVCLVGTENLGHAPTLIEGDHFADELSDKSDTLQLVSYRWDELSSDRPLQDKANDWIRTGAFDVVVLVPPGFAKASESSRGPQATLPKEVAGAAKVENQMQLLYNVGDDESTVAHGRVASVLTTWRNRWISDRIRSAGIDPERLIPFEWSDNNIAPENTREAAFWSKLLPFIMLVWALTGAFYPAIDLVAGEKERGTLETLLCSPALREEIVWGKLAAVATFSVMTAVLNAGSMLMTSSLVFNQMSAGANIETMGAPPLIPMLWLLVALIPLSALFSALALAVAAMAQSSKEGQYYLMPLMMVTIPLVMLPMLPGTTLNIGTSLIPVTGMFLLVRSLVEGQYVTAMFYFPLVMTVTGTCLWMATRWAKRQFEDEAVLFGGGDQWELGMWVKHLWRDRQVAASPAQGYACGAIILVTLFFARLTVTEIPDSFAGIAKLVIMPQVLILFPAILMATMMTTSLRKSLRLRMPHWTTIPLAILFGVTFHPTYVLISKLIHSLYPLSPETAAAMKPFTDQIASADWFSVVFLMAMIPAICEEIAFRGFIFGGLVRDNGKYRAILVTAVMFGISHGVLQQSIAATLMGLILGWITLRTGSLIPCMLVHVTNNALSVSMNRILASDWQGAGIFLQQTELGATYQPFWILVSMGISATCLLYFGTLDPDADEGESEFAGKHQDYVDPSTALASL